MIKSIVVGINLLAVLLFAMLEKSEVSITHDPPSSLTPGQEQIVTVVIDKSTVMGFAKFQVTVDPGLRIEPVETAGASFTFNEQKAKFIWMALPTVKKFEIKYRLVASNSAAAPAKLDSRFSYVFENERKNYDLPSHQISFGSDDVASQPSSPSPASTEPITLTGNRTITSAGINQWRVDVSITKTGIDGFAKLEEEIPSGYTAIDLKSSNAVFTIEDNSVKYLWYDFPDKETVVVSYKLLPVIAMDANEPEIDGSFAYLKDGVTKTLDIGDTYVEMVQTLLDTTNAEVPNVLSSEGTNIAEKEEDISVAVVPQSPVVEESTETPLAELPEEKTTVKPAPIAVVKPTPPVPKQPEPENTTSAKAKTDGNIVNVPQPEKGVYYRVQIAAGPNNLNREQFAKLYGFNEDLKLETNNGLLKYTTGYHQVYKSARDSRERIHQKYNKFKGPFVTAYNNGDRITVQEALMITSQKWFQ